MRHWGPGEIYLYTVRKPNGLLGWPILGRHVGYVGQTRNPQMRHLEHTEGGGRYGRPPARWSDLHPRRHVPIRLSRCPDRLLTALEWLVIKSLFPVYNVRHNRTNPRRITPAAAARQRESRDAIGWSPAYSHGSALLLIAALLVACVILWVAS